MPGRTISINAKKYPSQPEDPKTNPVGDYVYTENADGYWESPGRPSLAPTTGLQIWNAFNTPKGDTDSTGQPGINPTTGLPGLFTIKSDGTLNWLGASPIPSASSAGPAPTNGTTTVAPNGDVYYTPPFGGTPNSRATSLRLRLLQVLRFRLKPMATLWASTRRLAP